MTKKKLKSKKILSEESPDYLTSLMKGSNTGKEVENLWNAKDVIAYAEKKIGIKLDTWQKNYINTKGNTAVRAGRQSGKSFAQSLRVALFALLNPKTQTLIIGAVDRQSVELFEKVKSHIQILGKYAVKGRPTMHKIELNNGSKIIAQPAGRTGYGLRGYTINKLVVDEAHYVPEEVWTAVRPMLSTTKGTMDLLSTPRGNEGYFYEVFQEGSGFTTYHTKSEDCPRITKEFLDQERKRMTKLQYLQEYEAEFLDSLQQFFPRELIESCIVTPSPIFSGASSLQNGAVSSFADKRGRQLYMGVDVARYGGDQNSFVIVELLDEKLSLRFLETTEMVSAADTINRIEKYTEFYGLRKTYIDDGGIGGAVLDVLLEKPSMGYKIIGINNASRPIVSDKSKGRKIMKEDLYGNLKTLMERKLIQLPDNDDLINSLLSIQFEFNSETQRTKIFGRYTHITEGLIRAAWCIKTKHLRLWAC